MLTLQKFKATFYLYLNLQYYNTRKEFLKKIQESGVSYVQSYVTVVQGY